MVVYLLTILLILVLSIVFISKNENDKIIYDNRRLYYHVIIAIWFILFLGLRNDYMFTDTQNYRAIYENPVMYGVRGIAQHGTFFQDFGFYSFIYALHEFGIPFRGLLFIHAIVYIGSLSLLVYRYSSKPWLSYLLFMFTGLLAFATTMRQSFAVSFVILATMFAVRKNIGGYIVMIVLAISFHVTAIVAAPIYFIIKKWKNYTVYLFLAGFVLMTYFASTIMSIAVEETRKGYVQTATGGWFTILYAVIVLVVSFKYSYNIKQDKIFLKLYLMVVCFFPFAKLNPAFFRVCIYYSVFLLVLAPDLVFFRKKVNELVLCLFLGWGLIAFFYKSKQAGVRTFPYVFYWQDYFQENLDARTLKLMGK